MEMLHTIALLAWALLRTLLAHLVRATPGLDAFRRNYAADRLPAVAPDERRALTTFGACIACGLCDVGEGARIAASGGAYAGMMELVLASSRSMPDYDAAVRSFAPLTDARLAELEARCPTGVPMRRIAAFVRAKAAEVAAPLGGTCSEGMSSWRGP
jgi:succinate dehydrogenase/fumarate reductase-like Fe-S protein